MDTGILGFFLLLIALAICLYYLFSRYRAVERDIIARGFGKTDTCPPKIKGLLNRFISRDPEVCYKASDSRVWHENTWIIHLKDDPADEDSTIECALVTQLPRQVEKTFILRSLSGASANSLLGKAAIRLSEFNSEILNGFHRLKDPNNLLDFHGHDFVGYASEGTEITKVLPRDLIRILNQDTSKHIWHLAAEQDYLLIHTSWSGIIKVLDFSLQAYKIMANNR